MGVEGTVNDLQKLGFVKHPTQKGMMISKRFLREITAATVEGVADAVHDIQSVEEKPTGEKPTYPKDHVAGMRVPKGGSSCTKCEYLADNTTDCTNKYFQKWHGSPKIPLPIDEYCSDWFEPAEKTVAAAIEDSQAGQHDGSLWNGLKLTGFTAGEEEGLRAMLSRIPPELLNNVTEFKSAKELDAVHGRFLPDTKVIEFNPKNFTIRQRLGKGDGWLYHAELTVVHEVGHSIFDKLSPEMNIKWMRLNNWMQTSQTGQGPGQGQSPAYVERRPGWTPGTSNWTHKLGMQYPRYYSEKNPNECFADCFAFYILNKPQQMSPSIKEYMEKFIAQNVKRYPKASIE